MTDASDILPGFQQAARRYEAIMAAANLQAPASAVERSWRRCLTDHKLDPERCDPGEILTGFELRLARGESGRLLAAADGELERLHSLVRDLDYSVLMADADGVILAQRTAEHDNRGYRHWHLCAGAVWNEMREGTNGVGTCLAEQRPITIHRDAHFQSRYGRLSCSVAPVFGPGGDLAAALDVSSFRTDRIACVLPLVMNAVIDTARHIERRMFTACHPRALVIDIADLTERSPTGSIALLALDDDRRIVGATRAARDGLGLGDALIAQGCDLGAAVLDRAEADPGFEQAERSVVIATLARAQGNVTQAARLLGISRSTLHRKLHRLRMGNDKVP